MTYEFSEADGLLIRRVGLRLTTQGVLLVLAGLGGIIYSIINFGPENQTAIMVYIIQSIVEVIIGSSLFLAPPYFRRVAETQGKDIMELIGGIKQLNRAFFIVWTTLTVNLVLDIVLIVLSGG